MCAEVVLLDGLERLVRPLMLTCMDCFVGGVCISDLTRLAALVKLVVMPGCLEAMRSNSGVSPFGRLLNESASTTCQRLAIGLIGGRA